MSFHQWPKSGTPAKLRTNEKAANLATPPVWHCFLRTDGQVLAYETRATVLQGPYPILPNFVALWSPNPAPKHRWLSPCWLGPCPGAWSCFLQQIILFKGTLGKSTVLLRQQFGGKGKKKKKATCETWVILCLHFVPVTCSLGFSSCPSCGFSARSKQATHLSCLSLSFSFLKWAAHFLRTLVGCNQLGF